MRKRSGAAVNSRLIRRPIQYLFPVFLLPMVAAFCIGFVYPFLKGLFLSFCSFKTTSKWTWVGIDNYIKALHDGSFVYSFWYTVLFALVTLFLINVLAFAVAYVLTQGIKGSNIFRTVFFMPNLIGGIVLGYIWQLIFNGVLARYDLALKISAKYGFWGLVIVLCWQQIGYMMIIYIAGLQAVPEDLIEAAQIDGSTPWKTLWRIKLPMVMPSITICMFLTLTNSFKLFDQNLALTGGEPAHATEMLAYNIYNTFYSRAGAQWKGLGQAKAVLFCILVVAISILQLRATRSKEVQQ